MLLSTQSETLFRLLGYKEAIKVLKNAGFDAIDFSSFTKELLEDSDYLLKAKEIKKVADDYGIFFNQAHAPFPTSFDETDKTEDTFNKIIKSMEIASKLGAKNIIVHPKQHLKYVENDNKRILKEMNVEFYTSLIPYCKDLNVTVCLENMYQMKKENGFYFVQPSTCSSKEVLLAG